MTATESPQARMARTRLCQIARLVALQREGSPAPALSAAPGNALPASPLNVEALILRTVETMVRDCVELRVPTVALTAAMDGACWIGDLPDAARTA